MKDNVQLKWLGRNIPQYTFGNSFGVPWPSGKIKQDSEFLLTAENSGEIPVQSWPMAYWPDGSIKWTGHAVGAETSQAETFYLSANKKPACRGSLSVKKTKNSIIINNGVIECELPNKGKYIFSSIRTGTSLCAENGHLVCLVQDAPDIEYNSQIVCKKYESKITDVIIENAGHVYAVIKISGSHLNSDGQSILPFTVRFYFYSQSDVIRIIHTFIYNGNESKDFIRGLGLSFNVPMEDPLYDRHVRFAGENRGLWAEGVQNLSGLRRDPGNRIVENHLTGKKCPDISEFPEEVSKRMNLIPSYNDFSLLQDTPSSFTIRKRTDKDHCWLTAGYGRRAEGLAYIGGVSGGTAFGLKNFWQSFPGGLDIRNACSDNSEATLWLWPPDSKAMDMRFYHDGMGQNSHTKQLEGLEITYEDYEPGFDTPYGVARTSELFLFPCSSTPTDNNVFNSMSRTVTSPSRLVCTPEYYKEMQVFGGMWDLPDSSDKNRAKLENHLNWLIEYYQVQIEQHSWYGFWNYGDVMHSYDKNRHVWKYDIGGFAWDNSELSTDLWLWYSFLRTGRIDIFNMAEAMTRHTGEVDVYHLGRFKGLGSRHNVLHWGCSAKQVRISSAVLRRIFYYLTTDERTGELLHEVRDADKQLINTIPLRKYPEFLDKDALKAGNTVISIGTDWCSFAINWLTEWERTGNTEYRDKIIKGLKAIGSQKHGWFKFQRAVYNPETSEISPLLGDNFDISHLEAVFGAPELNAEILNLLDIPQYEQTWLEYCEMYNAPEDIFKEYFGILPKGNYLRTGYSRLTAFAAWKKKDDALKLRAWKEFILGDKNGIPFADQSEKIISGNKSLNPVLENPYVSTNDAALWSLAAIQNLALIGGSVISEKEAKEI